MSKRCSSLYLAPSSGPASQTNQEWRKGSWEVWMSVQVNPGSTEWNLTSPDSRASSSRVINMLASFDLSRWTHF